MPAGKSFPSGPGDNQATAQGSQFSQRPTKTNWLLHAGIISAVIVMGLVILLILQSQTKGDTSPPPMTTTTRSASTPPPRTEPLPSDAPTDTDGIPVIPVRLDGKTVPATVGTFELSSGAGTRFGSPMIYNDRTARPPASVLGTYSDSNAAAFIAQGLKDVRRIGNFQCGQAKTSDSIYCVTRTTDGSLYFWAGSDTPATIIAALANGVITGAT